MKKEIKKFPKIIQNDDSISFCHFWKVFSKKLRKNGLKLEQNTKKTVERKPPNQETLGLNPTVCSLFSMDLRSSVSFNRSQ